MPLSGRLRTLAAALGFGLAPLLALPGAEAVASDGDLMAFFASSVGSDDGVRKVGERDDLDRLIEGGSAVRGGALLDALDDLDVEGTRSLFSNSLLSVHVMDRDGRSVRIVALADCGQLDIARAERFRPVRPRTMPKDDPPRGFADQVARCDDARFSLDTSRGRLAVLRNGRAHSIIALPSGRYRINGSSLIVR